ncbi:aldo/keto reductase [Mycolicibacillus trivialis]|uniref:2,5-diketo-D-gluconic acid reductase n=1 Tax=Mycolicibacillus trivialis TaxID=1798 RepID=A0A1X2EQK2_9MYCO|nr:aldo/keto reductase [Mycolicibacillus trivialis]ORX08452.1 2,5-diketo-D-gluconic acid reductase [Mycolicibacillus trivialis]
MATDIPTIGLNDDNTMPVLGVGVGELSDEEAERAVAVALEAGARLIDTAAIYGNEAGVGRAIAASGVPRAELFVTTKLAIADQGFSNAQTAGKASLERLGLDYLDLYLVHWPAAPQGLYVDSFGGMGTLQEDGLTKSIGVSNFTAEHLANVIDLTFMTPAVNQIELHPLLNQAEMRATNAEHNVVTQSYSPLANGAVLDNPTVAEVAAQYNRTPAQVLLRWNLQLGNAVVFRSTDAQNIAGNLDVFDFELAEEHMSAINALHDGTRVRPDPDAYTGQ